MKIKLEKRSGYKMTERELEKLILKILKEEKSSSQKLLKEDGAWDFEIGDLVGGEIAATFIDPWVNVLKVIGYEITQTVANVVLTLRLFLTFNSKKAEEMIARHNDRMEKLKQKRDKVLKPLLDNVHGEFHIAAFMINPAAYLTIAVGSRAPDVVRGTADWLEQSGIIDVRAGEMRGEDQDPDRKAKRLEREREEQGPVKKALRALEQIFLLAHHEMPGSLISEQEAEPQEEIEPVEELPSKKNIEKGLEESGILDLAKDYQIAFKESTKEVAQTLEEFGSQVDLLANIALSSNYDELESGLSQIKSAIPKLDISELEAFKKDLKSAAEAYASDEEKIKELSLNILKSQGITDPTDEDISSVDSNLIEDRVMSEVFYGATSDLRSKIVNQLQESVAIYEEMVNNFKLPTGMPSGFQKLIDESEYAKDIQINKAQLEALKQQVNKVAGDIKKPVAELPA